MLLDSLNSKQKEAVLYTEGPLLILAGAGAGKTKTITHRIVHLINSGIEPTNILAVTFTNKAAGEMRERVDHLLRNSPDMTRPIQELERPVIKTFHSLGVQILKNHADILGYKKTFSIYDRDDSKRAIKNIIKDLGLDPKQIEPGKVISIISKQKGNLVSPEEYLDDEGSKNSYQAQNIYDIWVRYESGLKKEHAFDFDDLLSKTLELLQKHSEVRNLYQNKFKYIHIDEYQDTNMVQYELSKIFAEKSKNICVVGDVDQNIYSWRGATIKNIMNFENDYPEAKTILLEQNYRSTKNILNAANEIISKNVHRKEKNLFTENHDGEKIVVYQALDEYDEALFAVQKAQEFIKNGTNPNEIAFLFRANFQSRVLEEICLKYSLPHQVIGTRFFDRKEVKDLVAYLKLALNIDDFASLSRIINEPVRGIGKVTLLKIKEGKADELNLGAKEKLQNFWNIIHDIKSRIGKIKPSDLIQYILKRSTIEESLMKEGEEGLERLENAKELISLAKKYDNFAEIVDEKETDYSDAVEKFIEDVMLASDQDSLNKKDGGVKLMTVHAAKGLEFDKVFVTGLETGLFPHEKLSEAKIDEEEERRLFYVAITRAKRELFLTFASFRTIFGSKNTQIPSEFLSDISEGLIQNKSYADNYGWGKNSDDESREGRREFLIDF
jgi:DNA helicase II / ATP-dependent DNA helicase PcrA